MTAEPEAPTPDHLQQSVESAVRSKDHLASSAQITVHRVTIRDETKGGRKDFLLDNTHSQRGRSPGQSLTWSSAPNEAAQFACPASSMAATCLAKALAWGPTALLRWVLRSASACRTSAGSTPRESAQVPPAVFEQSITSVDQRSARHAFKTA